MAPVEMAKRLTTLVMATRPTFWLKEVLGSHIAAHNAQQDGGGAGKAGGAVLEVQDHSQHEDGQQQIFHGAEILGRVAAAEGVDAHGDQAQTDGHDNSAGNNRGEEFTQRLQEETQNAFKKTADDGCAHDGTISDNTATHGGGNRVENAQEAGGSTHDDGNIAAHGADGEQLDQGNDTGYQHGVLQQMQLQLRKLTAGDSAGAGNDQQRGQVADEHGQHVLQAQGDRLLQGHLAVQLIGFFYGKTSLYSLFIFQYITYA